jgi:hypothetical protein
MAEANVGKRDRSDGEGARGGIASPMDACGVRRSDFNKDLFPAVS